MPLRNAAKCRTGWKNSIDNKLNVEETESNGRY